MTKVHRLGRSRSAAIATARQGDVEDQAGNRCPASAGVAQARAGHRQLQRSEESPGRSGRLVERHRLARHRRRKERPAHGVGHHRLPRRARASVELPHRWLPGLPELAQGPQGPHADGVPEAALRVIVDLALPRLSNRRERSLRLRFGLEDRRIHTYREIASELKLTTYPTSYQYKRSLHSLFQSNHVWLERLHAWLNPARGDLSQADDRARAEWATELQADPEIIPAWVELERNYRKVYDLWRPG